MDLIEQAQTCCTDIINVVPTFQYNLVEDTVGIGAHLLTRTVVKSPEEYESLRQRIRQTLQSRLNNNFVGYQGNKRRNFNRDY